MFLSISDLEQNDSSKQATFKNFGGNFLIFQQL